LERWRAEAGTLEPELAAKLHEPAEKGEPLRRRLYRLLDAYREHSVGGKPKPDGSRTYRLQKCGRVRHEDDVAMSRRPDDGRGKPRGKLAGLIRCRTKACPVCVAHRRSQYAEEIAKVVDLFCAEHSTAPYMATFTIRHGMADPLELTGAGVRATWRKFISGRAWQDKRAELGLEYVVAEEVTHGKNGWHPHMHVLFIPRTGPLYSDEYEADPEDPSRRRLKPLPGKRPAETRYLELAAWMEERWCYLVHRHLDGCRTCKPGDQADQACELRKFEPLPDVALDLRPASSGEYIQKLGLELADPGTKQGRAGPNGDKGRVPLQILDDWTQDTPPAWSSRERDLALYQEYERVTAGRKDLTWSKPLQALRERAAELLAEEDKAAAAGDEYIGELPGPVWDRLRNVPDSHVRLLEAIESQGLAGVLGLVELELGEHEAEWVRNQSKTGGPASGSATLQADPKARAPTRAPPVQGELALGRPVHLSQRRNL
jgi:hypothetical protein